jgi:cysteine desulfuration protein SufE
MNAPPEFSEISENLSFLDDWEDRYRYLIELGQLLPDLADTDKTPQNKVNGCVSQVWLVTEASSQGNETHISFRGDSDAMIVKGLVAILLALYSGRPAAEIVVTDAIAILDSMGLREHLTAQRSNGLVAMVKRMRDEAARYT